MSAWSFLSEVPAGVLITRWTVVLVLAWCGHGALARRNPRWRVGLWRTAVLGLAVVSLLTLAPPVTRIPLIPAAEKAVVVPTEFPRPVPRSEGPSVVTGTPSVQPHEPVVAPTASIEVVGRAPRLKPRGLLAVWAGGVVFLVARLALGWFALVRITRRAREAPEGVAAQCREVAEALGTAAVRVVYSAEIATPCLAGLWRPVVLLPEREMADDDLQGVLAHELAHARGHDLAWNLFAQCAAIVLWFHPLGWRVRAAHASACDAVSDAVAADFLGDVPTYARTLARVALGALAPPPAPVLAMARSSDVRRRVDALDRRVFRSSLSRRAAAPAIVAAAIVLVLVGGVAVTVAEPPAGEGSAAKSSPDEAAAAADGRCEIQAVADASGKPVEGVAVTWQIRVDNGRYKKTAGQTNGDGRAALDWPKGATVNGLWVTARKVGFATYSINWDDRAHPLRIPATKVIRLVPGVTIGGVVTDEAGKPVAGAKVTVYAPPTETEQSNYSTDVAESVTDDRGRWRADDVPANPTRMSVAIEARGFLRGGGPPQSDLNAVMILKRGVTIQGRVTDLRGNPVAGAKVSGGDSWSSEPKPTTTDARGAFALENCPPGASLVTVQADGYAPDLREVHPEDRPTLEFRLAPGQTLRGRVLDRQGKPVAGVMVASDTWREHRSLDFRANTDKDGRFEWKSAPADAVQYAVFKDGYMRLNNVVLKPAAAEQPVTLDPELVISGRVTDAVTGKPVPAFRVVRGLVFSNAAGVHWMQQDAAQFAEGRYTLKHGDLFAGYAVRVEAAGYKGIESRVFNPTEGAASFDASLARAAAADLLTGVVLDPDGKPAAGVEVALATPDYPLLFEGRGFGHGNGMSFAKSGPDGRFSFDKPRGAYLLAAMSDAGYAEAPSGEPTTLGLVAWGTIKGEARIGRQPAANQPISLDRRDYQPGGQGTVNAFYGIETRTDSQGRFVFNRVIPGKNEVARVVITEFGNGSQQHMGCWQEPVTVAPGETVEVRIGGKGRAVVGRVILRAPAGIHVDWRQNRPATIEKTRTINPLPNPVGPDPRQNDRFAATLDKDGRFRVDDVPPGRYELTLTIDAPPKLGRVGAVQELGTVKVAVHVPDGNDDALVDLGEIAAEFTGH